MKKLSLFLGMALAASLSLTNCTEKIEGPIAPATPAGIPFEISADISTKTTNDGLATKWAEGDAINLFHAEAGKTVYVSDGEFKLDATRKGVFKGNLTSALDASKSYDWYAFYPYSEYNKTPAGVSKETFGYTHIGDKSQTQEGNDSKAHLCGAALPLYGVVKGLASDVKPKIAMNNLASVVAVKVKNTTTEPLVVKSVSFTSTEDIVGTYYIDFTGENVVYTGRGKDYVSATAFLTVNNGDAIAANAEATFYIPIKPHTVASGSILKISVNGYEKPLTLHKDVTFIAGKIKTLAFNYDKVVVDYVTLPWAIDGTGGKSIWTFTVGLSQNGLGSDYASNNAPYLTKFDTNGDYVQVKFNSPAKQVSFKVKMIGGLNTSYFTLQGSSNGSVFTDIEEFTVSGKQNSELSFVSSHNIDESYRILKLVFKKGSNVGLGAMSISANSTDPAIYADDITSVSARGESAGELVYTMENLVEGTVLSSSCDGTVVTSVIDNGDGKTFLYEVSKNLGVAREGWIKLIYGDVEKTIKVSQNAPVFKVTRTEVELDGAADSKTTLTITSDFDWIAKSSTGAGFTISPETYTWAPDGKQTVTITATAANDSQDGVRTLGTVTFTDAETFEEIVVAVKQKSSYISVGPSSITFTPANFTGDGISGTGGATTSLIEGVKVYTDKGFINGENRVHVYKNGIITISSETKTIKKIEFTSTASGESDYGPSKLSLQGKVGESSYSEKVTTWTGSSNSVSYKATAQYRFTKIVVTYE